MEVLRETTRWRQSSSRSLGVEFQVDVIKVSIIIDHQWRWGRAIDTGTYLLRSTYAIGTEDTGGRSLIAAPDGRLLGVAAGEPQVLSVTVDPQQKFNHQASYGQPMTEHRSLIESHRCPDIYRPNSPACRAGNPPR
ncbi:MAG TPA: hypothetical protein DIT01_12425 [Lentisphaeria bacterium]|nr:hypothetical protein [Lentisphaeria bacterium]